jgi:hypothetical protein
MWGDNHHAGNILTGKSAAADLSGAEAESQTKAAYLRPHNDPSIKYGLMI